MTQRKFYVSAKKGDLDLGLETEAENVYMAAIAMANTLWGELSVDDAVVTDVEEVSE